MNKRINNLKKRRRKRIFFRKVRLLLLSLLCILISGKIFNLIGISNNKITLTRSLNNNVVDNRISVVLDPGHGGYDTGALWEDICEKDVTLNISNLVGEILENNDINVIYTRTTDSALGDYEKEDLKNRIDIANNSNAKYLVSFHINDYECEWYESIYGFEVWTNFYDEASLNLGKSIENNLESLNYTQKREMLDGSEDLYMIRESEIPSVLIEFGFMNDYDDRLYFSDEDNQKLLAQAVANAILENINSNVEDTL